MLPKKVLQVINALCAWFLWHGNSQGGKIHPISWQMVCREKWEGGLGIRNFETFNEALLANQIWELNAEKNNLWLKWVHVYWMKGSNWWMNVNLKSNSWVMKRLLQCIDICKRCTEVIGNRLVWKGEGLGFTTKDTYKTLKEDSHEVDWYKLVWNRFNVPRASITSVLATHDRLLTKDRMTKYGIQVQDQCVFCSEEQETRDHLFFSCKVTTELCSSVTSYLRFSDAQLNGISSSLGTMD